MKQSWFLDNAKHIDPNYIRDTIQKSINIVGDSIDVANLLTILYSRYFFIKPLIYFESNLNEYIRVHSISGFKVDNNIRCVISIDLHNQIIICPWSEYKRNYNKIDYRIINGNYVEILGHLDMHVPNTPVNYRLTLNTPQDKIMRIFHNKYLFVFESKEYEVSRETLDILYAETQDFIFTENVNSGIVVRSEARHSIFHKGEFICDFLKNDLALLLDIQEKLYREFIITQTPYETTNIHSNTDNGDDKEQFIFDPNEFNK